ncbi:MAG: tRNA (N6-isopentenyl adenosine(37)-C2)-methylthiotransferase MiaB [Ruminococcaceae bacterium]|nr:tRNA (N6-isopentenyl adenosine(37)-C2)-methylthiotransferase MiaB [Oscillospiraceae bacterium]MBR3597248.1 tRNA (N6-isopentenyl adenosine(37)-C2)-methylthiotransferase MiaB [Clostridia bacterium]
MENIPAVSPEEIRKQREYTEKIKVILSVKYPDSAPKAYVHTYGCQGNVSDSERIKGQLFEMGYRFTENREEADLVLFNTCAVREHAQDRVFGNVGALKPIKNTKKDMIIALCGCMMQQKHVWERIKRSYPYVNLVFGTFAIHRVPELLYKVLRSGKRVFETEETKGEIVEGLPVYRDRDFKMWLPIMYGCNNFCSYCVVPYVRGRERSRQPDEVLKEARELISLGAKEITLLGQNVNSYGKNSSHGMNFPKLLKAVNDLPGDFKIRFMTSHPKDCTKELLDTMASCEKVSRHLHLPFQSGNDRVLREMNRGYTRQQYIELINYAKSVMPDISVTSDIIVGFPGETYEEFLDTLSLIEEVKFTSLFTFIFSPREGTKAKNMPDPVSYQQKSEWFSELLKLQESIAAERCRSMVGNTYEVLVEGFTKEDDGRLTGRTDGNINIDFEGDPSLIGTFAKVKVTKALNWILSGELSQ